MPVDLSVRGLIQTQRNLKRIADELNGEPMIDSMRRATLVVQREAVKGAPSDTGDLRRSITTDVRVSGIGGTTITGIVGSNRVQAAAMELGTKPHFPPQGVLDAWARRKGLNAFLVARAISRRGIKPRKYLERAFTQTKPTVVRILGTGVTGIIRK